MTSAAQAGTGVGGAPARANARVAALIAAEERLLACVHCGFCLDACPTYRRLGDEGDSPRGRILLMRAVTEGRLTADDPAVRGHIDRCLGCRACEPVCPSGVEYGFLVERARDAITRTAGMPLVTRLLLAAFTGSRLSRLVASVGRVIRRTGLAQLIAHTRGPFARLRLAAAMLAATRPVHWHHRPTRRLPIGARTGESGVGQAPMPGTLAPRPPAVQPAAAPSSVDPGRRVALLRGCVQAGLFAHVNQATEQVLAVHRCTLINVPVQTCCGALHAHSGKLDGARVLARRNVDAFEAADAATIVVNAAGCGAMMKEYGRLLEDDPAYADRAVAVAARVRDLSEYLVSLGVAPGGPLPLRAAYDAPCHLHHAQGITSAPLQMLRAIPGLEVVPLHRATECCGGAGIYGLLHPELGGRILRDKVDDVKSTGADVVVTPNPGCIMQIGAGLSLHGVARPVLHPVELLAESYRRRVDPPFS